ncbi:MAG: SIR2 family protein, partial [Fusobacteriaceae bacterium]
MSIADKLEQREKINIVMGDYFLKNTGMPSRTVLSNLFYMNFPVERKDLITDRNSFFKIAQGFLDFGIGNRGILTNGIIEHYMVESNRISKFKKFILSNRVESIISLDYDLALERSFGENIDKVSFQNPDLVDETKIRYYKCFGDVEKPQELIISGQDFRKFTILAYYKKYIENLRKEITDRKTIFFGCDLENSDFVEFFTF